MELAEVQQLLQDIRDFDAACANDDDSLNPDNLPHPYATPELKIASDENKCDVVHALFAEVRHAFHDRGRKAPPRLRTTIQMRNPLGKRQLTIVLALIRRNDYLWVWDVSGPDHEGFFYLHVTLDPMQHRLNLLQCPFVPPVARKV